MNPNVNFHDIHHLFFGSGLGIRAPLRLIDKGMELVGTNWQKKNQPEGCITIRLISRKSMKQSDKINPDNAVQIMLDGILLGWYSILVKLFMAPLTLGN